MVVSRRIVLTGPGIAWIMALLVIPCALLLVNSFFERGIYGGIDYIFTFENYARAIDPLYGEIFWNSARVAGITTLISLALGYPAAYCIALSPKRRQMALLILVMLPLWSNYLIRTYAWMVLLNGEGLINRSLIGLGLIEAPLPLLYNDFAIITGLTYAYVPFMILALFSSISKLAPELREASTDLGASPLMTFWRVTFPLTLPGIAAGCVFVFVLSIGNFVTPDLLGGGKRTMIGNLIYDQFLTARDWPFGSAIAAIVIFIMMALLTLQAVLINRRDRDEKTV
ncbi:ABC transporter permease [Dongia mobilis]|jgi:spermidine/putrescine transport system permease protein|uniref:ABC transporter permease n=1 Tax=Dongia sp. TaxID=1977262 RepID=UPI0026ECA616